MQVDYLIVGQGIAGTFLHYYLTKAGYKVITINENKPNTASKVASGVINPVTGRRLSATWMIDTIMPFANQAYQEISNFLGIQSVIEQKNITNFFPTPQMQLAFQERLPHIAYLQWNNHVEPLRQYFNFPFGVGLVLPCYWIDVNALLLAYEQYLMANNLLVNAYFNEDELTISSNSITYKHYNAKKIFLCNGVEGMNSNYFNVLPYAKNKGEAIIASIPNLPKEHIYKMGLTLVPWKNNDWWIGSTYEWNFTDVLPTATFRNKVETTLNSWLRLPFEIKQHFAAERPANLERRPFVGLHPVHPVIGILNGLGTKGCSLAPFFAAQLTNHIKHNTTIEPAANVQRFSKMLSK